MPFGNDLSFMNQINVAGTSVFVISWYLTDLKTAAIITSVHAAAHYVAAMK